jgi:hypothetical protein
VFASAFTKREGAQPQVWKFIKQADIANMPQALKDAFLAVNPDSQKLKATHDKDAARIGTLHGFLSLRFGLAVWRSNRSRRRLKAPCQ